MGHKLKQLTRPMNGVSFWLCRILFHFNFAKSFYWDEDIRKGTRRNTYWISVHSIRKPIVRDSVVVSLVALTFIFGPLKMTIGYNR